MSDDDSQKIEYIKTIFDHNQGLIELADTKANIVLGINSILIPLIFGVTTINFIDLLDNNLLIHAILLNTFSIIGLVLLVISFVYSTSSNIVPQFKQKKFRLMENHGRNLIL